MKRRTVLQALLASAGSASFALTGLSVSLPAFAQGKFAVKKSREEWLKLLSGPQYAILFEEDTERSFTSPLNDEKRAGTFVCAACFQPLFKSSMKYNSGTGWPSFFDALPKAVGTKSDYKLLMRRTEYHCSRCGGHQGHIFEDGPKPTGLRYCNNGLALNFIPDGEKLPDLRT